MFGAPCLLACRVRAPHAADCCHLSGRHTRHQALCDLCVVAIIKRLQKGGQYDELATNPEARRFDGTVLGYITPW